MGHRVPSVLSYAAGSFVDGLPERHHGSDVHFLGLLCGLL